MKSKKDITFNRILESCEFRGISHLLSFWYNWNQEIIIEFYSTLFFDKKEKIFMWMANGRRFNIKLTQFVELLRLSFHLDIPKKLHTGRVMSTLEMAPMYVQDSGFRAPRIDGILPQFVVLHRMRRRTLAPRRTLEPRIGDSYGIPAYERNLLDALMKHEWFDVFHYIVDEIWNIAINPLQSCGFASYIMYVVETVAHERFYKDVAHEPLRPAVPKDSARCHTSPPSDVAPTRTTHGGGASSSSSSSNSSFLKMFRGIFAVCYRTD
jgi:hypothetical protein